MQKPLKWRRLWVTAGWGLVLFVVYLSLTPDPLQLAVAGGDKFGHLLAYAAMMSWFVNLYEQPARRVQLAIGFVALAVCLEFVQRWTGYRSFELADMAAGVAGVAAGWFFAPPRAPHYLRAVEKVFHGN